MSDPDPRAAAREAVQAAFARGPAGPPVRACPSCGTESATDRAFCPACGKRYDRRLPWLSDRARLVLAVVGGIAFLAFLALVLPGVFEARDEKDARDAREQAARVARERARLIREQRPVRGGAPELRGDRTVTARTAMAGAFEAAILGDARARVAAGRLDGPIERVECGPLRRDRGAQPDHLDPKKPIGRYDCVAVKTEVVKDGKVVGLFGHPFIGVIDFRRATFVWCKDHKVPGERGKALATVPLDAACLAAEGQPTVAGGYLMPEE